MFWAVATPSDGGHDLRCDDAPGSARMKQRLVDRMEVRDCRRSRSADSDRNPADVQGSGPCWSSALTTCRRGFGDPSLPTNGSSPLGTHLECTRAFGATFGMHRHCHSGRNGRDSHIAAVQRQLSAAARLPGSHRILARNPIEREILYSRRPPGAGGMKPPDIVSRSI